MRLIAFPFHDWRKGQVEGFRTRDLHVLEWIGRDPRVETLLVVDRPVSLADRLARRTSWHVEGDVIAERRAGAHRARVTKVGDRTFVLDQSTLAVLAPIRARRGWWFDAFDDPATLHAIEWAMSHLGPADAAIAWQPAVWPVLEQLRVPFVFDSLDNWLIHPALAAWRERSAAAYRSLLPRAAAAFVSAPASKRALGPWRLDIQVVPNGVDLEQFRAVQPRPADLPRNPVVTYVGKLAQRIDTRLVSATARACPSIAFAFVGPELERKPIRPLHGLSNVHLLGDRPYDAVPGYIQHSDVCWIPHSVGAGETGGDPIKLYEYWAAGKPVVSTRIDGMDVWAKEVALVEGADEAAEAILGLVHGRRGLPAANVPEGRTWEAITRRLLAPVLGGSEAKQSAQTEGRSVRRRSDIGTAVAEPQGVNSPLPDGALDGADRHESGPPSMSR